MQLLVHELDTSRYQELTTDHKVKQIVTIRPHLYRKGSPAGTVKVQIRTTADVLVAESAARNISSLGTGTYWHGYANFDVSAHLAKATSYRFTVVTAGYTYAAGSYVAWVSGHELGKYPLGFTPVSTFESAHDIEIWSRRHVRKGIA